MTGQATCKFWNVDQKGVIMHLPAVCLRYTCIYIYIYIYLFFMYVYYIYKNQETSRNSVQEASGSLINAGLVQEKEPCIERFST